MQENTVNAYLYKAQRRVKKRMKLVKFENKVKGKGENRVMCTREIIAINLSPLTENVATISSVLNTHRVCCDAHSQAACLRKPSPSAVYNICLLSTLKSYFSQLEPWLS